MASSVESGSALASSSLEAFFHHSVSRAIRHQGVEAREVTVQYLVRLLTHFSRSENLFDYTDDGIRLRPLAQMYAQAQQSESASERRLVMRRMGDVALFIAGMFSGFFERRRALVGMDYYIAMGGQAYGCLSESRGNDPAGRALGEVYAQLSRGFGRYVLVLAEIGDDAAARRIAAWSSVLEAAGKERAGVADRAPGWPGWIDATGHVRHH